ncbi:MAG: hypothetical protein LIO92_12715 [Clostridiales bacterium]|nr:hypothetical protein [Clostridiales bacterium]
MRRIRILLLAMATAVMLAGCGSGQDISETAESAGSTENMETVVDEERSEADLTEAIRSEDVEEVVSKEAEDVETTSEDEMEASDAGEDMQEDNTMILTVNGTNLTAGSPTWR